MPARQHVVAVISSGDTVPIIAAGMKLEGAESTTRSGRCSGGFDRPHPMPIRRHHRWLYPIDWRELSASIRFRRAKGRCEGCGRPHGRVVLHLGDGRWWDEEAHRWRDGAGRKVRRLPPPHSLIERTRTTRVVLATAHRDHDPHEQRWREPRGPLPALPHPPRQGGAPPPPPADLPGASGARGPVHRTVSAVSFAPAQPRPPGLRRRTSPGSSSA